MAKTFMEKIPAAEMFIDTAAPTVDPAEIAPITPAPEGYYRNPEYIEAKSKRVQLLVKPSLYNKGKAEAEKRGISLNELINTLLEEI